MWRFDKQVNLDFTTLFLVFILLGNYCHTYYKNNINFRSELIETEVWRNIWTKKTTEKAFKRNWRIFYRTNFKLFNCPASVIHSSKYQAQVIAWKWITINELRIITYSVFLTLLLWYGNETKYQKCEIHQIRHASIFFDCTYCIRIL